MPIRFEVSGDTAEEFATNALQAYAVIAVGLQQVAQLQQQAAQGGVATSSSAESSPQPSSKPDIFPASDQVGAKPEVPTMEPLENPKAGETVPVASKSTAKAIKLEDIKTRLSEVITAATDRGWSADRRNAYAKKLLASVGASKVTDVGEEDRDTFMRNSHAFLSGIVAEA